MEERQSFSKKTVQEDPENLKQRDDRRQVKELGTKEKLPSKKRLRDEEEEEEDEMPKLKQEEAELELPMFNRKGDKVGVMLTCPCYYDRLKDYRFNVNKGYASCSHSDIKGRVHLYIWKKLMQREIPPGLVVDHINSKNPLNSLDNRCCNLRLATPLQNSQNRHKKQNPNATLPQSKFNNVSYAKNIQKWKASLMLNSKRVCIGFFDTDIQAAEAFDCFLWHNRVKFNLNQQFNFPDKDYSAAIPYELKEHKKKYVGVTKRKTGRFGAQIYHTNSTVPMHIGYFDTEVEAAEAYDAYVVKHRLFSKKINFPDNHPTYDSTLHRIKTQKEDCENGIHCILRSDDEGVNSVNIKISIDDYDKVKYRRISVNHDQKRANIKVDGKTVKLHRYLLGVDDPKIFVEHYPNSNAFDCTRENLRKGNARSNGFCKKPRKGQKYSGVHKDGKYTRCRINFDGKCIFDKCFDCDVDAARGRDLFLLGRTDLPPGYMNFTDWETPGVRDYWEEKLQMKKT
jgi:hypothetical protein